MNTPNKIIPFLTALAANNNKPWFEANKSWYNEARTQLLWIVEEILEELWQIDPSVGKPEARKCIFRINRDIRFSPNKNPYKSNMGAFFVPGGKSSPAAGYYLHLEPGESFVGGGIYRPEKELLHKIRREIYFNAEAFKNIIEQPGFKNTFGGLMDEKLKRPPLDFPGDFQDIDLLKYTSYVAGHPIKAEEMEPNQIVSLSLRVFGTLAPMVNFLNQALQNASDE